MRKSQKSITLFLIWKKIRYEDLRKVHYVVFNMNKKIRNEKIIKAHYVFFVEKILIFLYNTIKNHLIQK